MTQAIGIVGCGSIGRSLLRAADTGQLGVPVAGVTSRTASAAREFLETLDSPPPYLETDELVERSSLLIETAGSHVVPPLADAAFDAGKDLMVISIGALLEHPEQRDLLCARPELLNTAVEEILRWTTPVVQFARTAAEDFELRGVKIRAGQDVGLFYPSANRDEDVFEDPYRFDITRSPNNHLAFGGYGAHFCLGANLARWELRSALRSLLPILPEMELAGPEQRVAHLHVPAIHSLPVRHSETVAVRAA